MSESNNKIRDRVRQGDVTVMKSYLEVDMAEWFSDNEIPYAYEPFVIPSVVGPSGDYYNRILEGIRERSVEIEVEGEKRHVSDLWLEIYQKHALEQESFSPKPLDSLKKFGKRMVLPDFVIYNDANIKKAGGDFDWSNWDNIVEVSGLWGVGLPGEATEDEWWNWYRVSAVAMKELLYKALGLWDSVYWVVPDQDDITDGIREDDHYIVSNSVQRGLGVDRLIEALDIPDSELDEPESMLSPPIEPINYDRDIDNDEIRSVEYEYSGIDFDAASSFEDTSVINSDYILYYGDLGEVYISEFSINLRESQWRNINMILAREYVVDVLKKLYKKGVINKLEEVGE